MLDAVIETVTNRGERPMIHSDRSAHYRWPGRLNMISNAQLVRSTSLKTCSQNNAACGRVLVRLEAERFYSRDWKSITIKQFGAEVDA